LFWTRSAKRRSPLLSPHHTHTQWKNEKKNIREKKRKQQTSKNKCKQKRKFEEFERIQMNLGRKMSF
jgi:hypothetical protein